jgi:predicted transcriptional regulator
LDKPVFKTKFVKMNTVMGALKIIDQEIVQYLSHLNAKQKQAVLGVVKTFAAEQQDWWDEIGEEQQQAIDKSLAEMKAGKLTPHGEVMKKYKKWLKK